MKTVAIGVLLLMAVLFPPSAASQADAPYVPTYRLPDAGRELVVLFFSSSDCVGNQDVRLDATIRAMKSVLSRRMSEHGHSFATIGVATDWSPEVGWAYLLQGRSKSGQRDFGAWDEVQVGRNWLGTTAVNHVWRSPDGVPAVPQLIVYEHTLDTGTNGIRVGQDRVLRRLVGPDEIIRWFDEGMPLASPFAADGAEPGAERDVRPDT